jgi:spermidine synthase
VLVLGTGLASAVHVLRRFGCRPRFTLVEIDPLVLEWAMEFLPDGSRQDVRPVCANAFGFISTDRSTYDLIIVDIFFGREVPDLVTQHRFLRHCCGRLRPGGHLMLNFMVNRYEDEARAKTALSAVFKQVKEMSFGINRVYIAK